MITYRQSQGLALTKLLLSQKITYQFSVINERRTSHSFLSEILNTGKIENLFLIEARAARMYWRKFGEKIKNKIQWNGRSSHSKDLMNTLLDIGYHYLTGCIIKICQEINLPTELGIFHKAQSGKAHPLAYDFIEPLRAIMVDDVILKILGKKKKKIEKIDKKLISFLIYRIKKMGDAYYFNKKLGYCITLNYWTRLLLLEFMGSVNSSRTYHPIFPSLRHETRCKIKTTPKTEVASQ